MGDLNCVELLSNMLRVVLRKRSESERRNNCGDGWGIRDGGGWSCGN